MNLTYMRFELIRLLRNRRFFFFTLVFPLVLFVIFGVSNKNTTIDEGNGVTLKYIVFYMVAMAGYGAMMAAISGGARIAAERSVGWNRQLRLTPLPVSTYFAAKVITAYLMAIISILVLFAAGLAFGVSVHGAGRWVTMIGLILVAILPFVALGVALGHLLTVDSMGPALGGAAALFAILGGIFYPLQDGSTLEKIGELIPSYWISQASHVGVGADAWPAKGWLVVVVWTIALVSLAAWAYRRDSQRV